MSHIVRCRTALLAALALTAVAARPATAAHAAAPESTSAFTNGFELSPLPMQAEAEEIDGMVENSLVDDAAAAIASDGGNAPYSTSVYPESAWTTDAGGRAKTRFARGDRATFAFRAVNRTSSSRTVGIRVQIYLKGSIDTFQTLFDEPRTLSGRTRYTLGLPVVIEADDIPGEYDLSVNVDGTTVHATFWIDGGASGVPGGGGGVVVPPPAPSCSDRIATKYRDATSKGIYFGSAVTDGTLWDGCYRHYQYGAIYSSASGTFETHGLIFAKWLSLRNAGTLDLGAPTSDELDVYPGMSASSKYGNFQRGAVYWKHGASEAFGMIGAIRDAWQAGGGWYRFGFPVSDTRTNAMTGVQYNTFEAGQCTLPATGGALCR